ncbi:cytochrome b5-like isoform X2 [Ceratina calcarata]|uniref:Cytochrome b5 n=1 Tax=Ceratina calcarata TaxID=156304 RepID=A0AAJ7WBQ0_9HYME|nr:cytochrome b5-like isoform X2 [Ceratina calcarata]
MASVNSTEDTKYFTRKEVSKHTDSNDLWFIINNKVYDVTKFTSHPGGQEILLEQGGKDSTEAFEDIGHSSDARELLETFKIGDLVKEDIIDEDQKRIGELPDAYDSSSGSWRSWLIPIALGVLATLVYRYFLKAH